MSFFNSAHVLWIIWYLCLDWLRVSKALSKLCLKQQGGTEKHSFVKSAKSGTIFRGLYLYKRCKKLLNLKSKLRQSRLKSSLTKSTFHAPVISTDYRIFANKSDCIIIPTSQLSKNNRWAIVLLSSRDQISPLVNFETDPRVK